MSVHMAAGIDPHLSLLGHHCSWKMYWITDSTQARASPSLLGATSRILFIGTYSIYSNNMGYNGNVPKKLITPILLNLSIWMFKYLH